MHPISENTEISFFTSSEKHPNSEGIKFYSDEFSGEIFYYNSSNQYIEIEILENKTANLFFKIIDLNSDTDVSKSITKFLDKVLDNLD